MFKKYFTVLFAFYGFFGLFAQQGFSPSISFGVRGGISHSNVYFDPVFRTRAVDVPGGGVFFKYISEPNLGVQLEMNYISHGWKEENDSLGPYSRKMNYLEFPFLTHIEIGKKTVKVILDLGPYVAIERGLTEEYNPLLRHNNTGDTIILGEKNYYGIKPERAYDYGFLGGVGIGAETKMGFFSLDFRYKQGLVNIFEKFPKGNFRYSYSQSYFIGVSYSYKIVFKPRLLKNVDIAPEIKATQN
ncbi:MAG: PorT family protein [Bacteroidales bacterium]|nr:PorT family protein [Bacteroidales bacterium]